MPNQRLDFVTERIDRYLDCILNEQRKYGRRLGEGQFCGHEDEAVLIPTSHL